MALTLALVLSVNSFALLTYNSVKNFRTSATVSGNSIKCSLYVETENSTDSITASAYLYYQLPNGRETMVESWTLIPYRPGGGILDFVEFYPNAASGTYRFSVSIYVDGADGEDFIGDEVTVTKS